MKKVVHLMTNLGCGGLEKVVVNTINATHQHVSHFIISLTDDLTMASELPENVKIFVVHKKEGRDLSVYRKILQLLQNIQADVVNTYNFGTMEYQVLAWIAGCKKRVHIDHGLGGDPTDGRGYSRRLFRKVVGLLLDAYVVVSDDLKKFITDKVGIQSDKVHLIRNGITLESSEHQPESSMGGLTLMTVGRLVEVKNQQALIRAAHQWNKNNPLRLPVHVMLVGDGVLRKELEQLTVDIGAQATTHFMGQSMSPWQYATQADAFILTSLYEAMPMTILEAMARSIPVLCAEVGGVGDFISNKEAILFTGDNDRELYLAIDYLYDLPDFARRQLGVQGFNFVQNNFSLQKMTDSYLSIWTTH